MCMCITLCAYSPYCISHVLNFPQTASSSRAQLDLSSVTNVVFMLCHIKEDEGWVKGSTEDFLMFMAMGLLPKWKHKEKKKTCTPYLPLCAFIENIKGATVCGFSLFFVVLVILFDPAHASYIFQICVATLFV